MFADSHQHFQKEAGEGVTATIIRPKFCQKEFTLIFHIKAGVLDLPIICIYNLMALKRGRVDKNFDKKLLPKFSE